MTIGDAFRGPGSDTRQWVSYGTVDEDTPEAPATRFNDADGAPLETGPLVSVTLQPSGVSVVCRVASFIAGLGEAAWIPFQRKDEVLVVVPEGNELAGCVIVGRMNQGLDLFPAIVAGQDATKNNFGFWRLRTPFVIESAEAFTIRSAKTGSQIGIDSTGQVIVNNGDKNQLVIGSDAMGLGTGDGKTLVQIAPGDGTILLQADGTQWSITPKGATFLSSGSINIGSGGLSGSGHAVTVEQMITYVNAIFLSLSAAIAGPWVGAAIAALFAPPSAITATTISAASTLPIDPSALVALAAAFNVPTDPTGIKPGLGRPSFLL